MQGGTTENVWVDTAVAAKVWALPKGPGGKLWAGAPWPSSWPRVSVCTHVCSVYVCAHPCTHSVCHMVSQLPLASSRLIDTGGDKGFTEVAWKCCLISTE